MVRIEVGGKPVFEIPCVDIPERNVGRNEQIQLRRSHNTTSSARSRVNFEWSTSQPRLVITSDTEDFDEEILHHFQEEGYQITYLPYSGDHNAFQKQLRHFADPLDLGETYAIVAYGDAAALVLESCMRPTPKLCAVVTYYPPYMPKTSINFPRTLNLLIHLAGSQKFGTRHQKNFRYPGTQSGFAESDLEEYDKPAARVAWSRTIATLKKGFGVEANVEGAWDYHVQLRDDEQGVDGAELMETMTKDASVNCVPTMTGGIGHKRLARFYEEIWSERPADFKTKLLSRTTGTDRVVDEMLVSFTHTSAIDWMLPGVPPTGKEVEVAVVIVAAIRGGSVSTENVYWDQASVLLQVGLLDPSLVPKGFKTKEEGREKEVEKLPVLGADAARKVADEEQGRSNVLIPGWKKEAREKK